MRSLLVRKEHFSAFISFQLRVQSVVVPGVAMKELDKKMEDKKMSSVEPQMNLAGTFLWLPHDRGVNICGDSRRRCRPL
jgi:hypothetical protein